MKTQSAKAKGRRCRRCKEVFYPEGDSRICDECKKRCSTCNTYLTEDNWDLTGRLLRNQYRCKECVSLGVKSTRGNKGFCQESYDLKRHYGISKKERDFLFKKGCEVCGSRKRLCVDHDHQTGKVRGCLCSRCNTAIGMFDDDRKRLLSAERYLRCSEEK